MENDERITLYIISYTFSVPQSNFIMRILLIDEWYLESKIARIMVG